MTNYKDFNQPFFFNFYHVTTEHLCWLINQFCASIFIIIIIIYLFQ